MEISKKRMTFILIIAIALVSSIVLLTSYAWWRVKDGQTGTNDLLGACLKLSYTEEKDSNNNPIKGFNLESSYPITDSEASLLPGYSFTITNTCDEDVNYEVVIESLKTQDPTKPMPEEYVRFKIDGNPVKKYSELPEVDDDSGADYYEDILKTRQIYSDTLPAQQSVTHNVKSWIGEDATKEVAASNQFESKVKVRAGQGIVDKTDYSIGETDPCFIVNAAGVLVKYNKTCGTDVVIPSASVGIPIKEIASNAFYETHDLYEGMHDYTEDDIEFSMANSKHLSEVMENSGDNVDMSSLSANDVWIVKYKDTPEVDQAIAAALQTEDIVGFMNTIGITADDILICNLEETDCDLGYMSVVYKTNNDGSEVIGYRYSYQMAVDMGISPEELGMEFVPTSVDFSNATNLEVIQIGAFADYNPAHLELPVNVKIIADNAFKNYTGVSSKATGLGLSESEMDNVQSIDEVDLDNLILPNKLETIGSDAFKSYRGQDQELVIPSSVKTIDNRAFLNFRGYHIAFNEGLISIGDEAFNNYGNEGDYVADSKINLPSTLRSIGARAFYCYEGSDLVLPNNLVTIGDNAFTGYEGKNKDLVIPASVRTIGDAVFYNYTGSHLVFNEGLQSIGNRSFYSYTGSDTEISWQDMYNQGLTESQMWDLIATYDFETLILPNSLTSSGGYAFYNYMGMGTTLTIPNGLTIVPEWFFPSFRGDNLVLGDNLREIGECSFENYVGTNHPLYLNDNITKIGSTSFDAYNGPSLHLPNALTNLGSAFSSYEGIGQDLVIPNGVTSIDHWTFKNFKGTSITLPNNLTEIGAMAFYNYNGNPVDIPASVTTVLIAHGAEAWPSGKIFNAMQNTITVHNSTIFDNRSTWTAYPDNVVLDS